MYDIDEFSDARPVIAIGRYSEVARAEVYRRHGGAVFGLAKRVLHRAPQAEEGTREVFLRLGNAMRRARSSYEMQHEPWDQALARQVTRVRTALTDAGVRGDDA